MEAPYLSAHVPVCTPILYTATCKVVKEIEGQNYKTISYIQLPSFHIIVRTPANVAMHTALFSLKVFDAFHQDSHHKWVRL